MHSVQLQVKTKESNQLRDSLTEVEFQHIGIKKKFDLAKVEVESARSVEAELESERNSLINQVCLL